MAEPIIEPNFTISDAALAALASLKAHMTRDDPDNPPAVAMVAWGLFYDKHPRGFGPAVDILRYQGNRRPFRRQTVALYGRRLVLPARSMTF
jgi:hypothetical protein